MMGQETDRSSTTSGTSSGAPTHQIVQEDEALLHGLRVVAIHEQWASARAQLLIVYYLVELSDWIGDRGWWPHSGLAGCLL